MSCYTRHAPPFKGPAAAWGPRRDPRGDNGDTPGPGARPAGLDTPGKGLLRPPGLSPTLPSHNPPLPLPSPPDHKGHLTKDSEVS